MSFNIYILGKNSFIAKNLYLKLKPLYINIFLLSHTEIDKILPTSKDIIINCCGVNRSKIFEDYDKGNYMHVKKIIDNLKKTNEFFIHISSLMVHGFQHKETSELSEYQQWFITTKLKGEEYIQDNYQNYCIVRPSNVYGYNCEPYYNNLLSTMVYEKIKGYKRINKLNQNCVRNMISIDGLCNELLNIIKEKRKGIFDIVSNNDVDLKDLCLVLYNNQKPGHISFEEGGVDVPNTISNQIIVKEHLGKEILKLEQRMKNYIYLKENIIITQLNKLSQPRGDMVEISNLQSKRLYKITLTEHSIRGNHFHYQQVEEFYNNRGQVTYILSKSDDVDTMLLLHTNENTKINIQPYVVHTVVNDFIDNIPEIIISSTQEYVPNSAPDTKYINLV